jgi:hypothetical protein
MASGSLPASRNSRACCQSRSRSCRAALFSGPSRPEADRLAVGEAAHISGQTDAMAIRGMWRPRDMRPFPQAVGSCRESTLGLATKWLKMLPLCATLLGARNGSPPQASPRPHHTCARQSLAQPSQEGIQRQVILGPHAAVDMDHHPRGVDVTNLQIRSLSWPKAQRVNLLEVGVVVGRGTAAMSCRTSSTERTSGSFLSLRTRSLRTVDQSRGDLWEKNSIAL